MSWNQLRQLTSRGHVIGAHSMTHLTFQHRRQKTKYLGLSKWFKSRQVHAAVCSCSRIHSDALQPRQLRMLSASAPCAPRRAVGGKTGRLSGGRIFPPVMWLCGRNYEDVIEHRENILGFLVYRQLDRVGHMGLTEQLKYIYRLELDCPCPHRC